jgi:hypothetical protein|tara:strand:+ start:529 stop:807 length:279 start_codon:yes stop_codon:yes gene_type:complete
MSEELTQKELHEIMNDGKLQPQAQVNEYLIHGKGYYSGMVNDPTFFGLQMSDVNVGYGYIEVKCTEDELTTILENLYKDETYFKVIGVHKAN